MAIDLRNLKQNGKPVVVSSSQDTETSAMALCRAIFGDSITQTGGELSFRGIEQNLDNEVQYLGCRITISKGN